MRTQIQSSLKVDRRCLIQGEFINFALKHRSITTTASRRVLLTPVHCLSTSSLKSTSNGHTPPDQIQDPAPQEPPSCHTRRAIIFSASSLVLIGRSVLSLAEDDSTAVGSSASRKVFLDVSVDKAAPSRLIIELFDDVPIGAQRFLDLAIGQEGVRYQATKFTKLADVNSKSLDKTDKGALSIAGGDSIEALLKEFEAQRHSHNTSGIVSLVVKNAIERPKKKKLVAIKGKFVTVEEGGSIAPNGTAFAITTGAVQELDSTNLVVGRVMDGMDTIQKLQQLPRVKNNSSSAFYKTAKFFGDVRADIAELSFDKPYSKITVTSSGEIP